ncbi:NlpC/P60 family protein [Microlunatus sp. Gsoil 973]|uniref:C40 family peptidase n=1 Tax=Microlunatus sp. Gsoil 973 TaxID=2672569 RepID=UPI0018A84602|nr:NlpC/P60 family protein [Microlunatus sp. Gsoil 973]
MRQSGQQPAARRADLSASKPSSRSKSTPRRAATPAAQTGSAFLKRAGRTTAGLAVGAAMVGGLVTMTAEPASANVANRAPQLHAGMRGTAVVRLQRELSAHGKNVPDTGYFGSKTKKRVNHLKRQHGWRADGIAGHRVWNVLLHDGHRVSSPSLFHHSTASSSTGSSKGKRALKFAKKQLGKPYRYGADGPRAYDCSGLTLAAYRSIGVHLSHSSTTQYRQIKHVKKSHLKLGDLVFFYGGRSHVAIYAGHGKVIHAGRPGEPIEYIKMKYMPYNGAGRPA